MPLTIFGWPRVKTLPKTVLELVIEAEVDVRHEENNRFELIIRPKSIPEVILRNERRSTERAILWHWDIGTFWYNNSQKLWLADLSMTTGLHDEEGKLIAAGCYDDQGNPIATYYPLVDGQRLRFHRGNPDMFRNSPIQFYPEVRVRIRCQECNEPRR